MLMALTWGGEPDHFTSSAERRQPGRALISCYRLAFTGSPRQSIQLLHIRAEDESASGVLKKKVEKKGRGEERERIEMTGSCSHFPIWTFLSALVPLSPPHFILNGQPHKKRDFDFSLLLSISWAPDPSCFSGRYQSLSLAVPCGSIRSADLLHINDAFR